MASNWKRTAACLIALLCMAACSNADGAEPAPSAQGSATTDIAIPRSSTESSARPAKNEGDAYKPKKVVVHDEYSSFSSILSTDGGYVVAGYLEASGVLNDIIIARYDENLKLEWTAKKSLLGIEFISELIELADGYVVVGYTVDSRENGFATGFMFKVDKDGQILWTKEISKLDDSTYLYGAAVIEDGFVLSGYVEARGNNDYDNTFLAKYDLDGNELWFKHQVGYFNDISNTGSQLATIGVVEQNGDYPLAAIALDYEGELISVSNLLYYEVVAVEGGYLQSFDNEFFLYYGDVDLNGYMALIDKNCELVWETAIEDGDMEICINYAVENDDELVFVGWAANEDEDYGLIGKIGKNGQGLSYSYVDDERILNLIDVVPCEGGMMTVGHAFDRRYEDIYGVLALFDI